MADDKKGNRCFQFAKEKSKDDIIKENSKKLAALEETIAENVTDPGFKYIALTSAYQEASEKYAKDIKALKIRRSEMSSLKSLSKKLKELEPDHDMRAESISKIEEERVKLAAEKAVKEAEAAAKQAAEDAKAAAVAAKKKAREEFKQKQYSTVDLGKDAKVGNSDIILPPENPKNPENIDKEGAGYAGDTENGVA